MTNRRTDYTNPRRLQEEKIIVDLLKFYMNEELEEKEFITIDPEVDYYTGEQHHIWFHQNVISTSHKRHEMIGWFHVNGSVVELVTFTKLPWDERGPDMIAHNDYNVSDPQALRTELRAAIDRSRTFLRKRTTHGK